MCSVPSYSIKVFMTLFYISIISQSLHINALEWDLPIWHPRMPYGIIYPPPPNIGPSNAILPDCIKPLPKRMLAEHYWWHGSFIRELNIFMCDISMYLRLQPYLPVTNVAASVTFISFSKHSFGKVINEVSYQACDLMKFIQQTYIYILHQPYEYHLSHAVGYQMIVKKQTFFSFYEINANFGTKNKISHLIICHYMISEGCIMMIVVYACIIWFRLDCIMQLK